MDSPLLYGAALLLSDTPWYLMACVPFADQARLKKGTIFLLGLVRAWPRRFPARCWWCFCRKPGGTGT